MDDTYYFHQTPSELASVLVSQTPFSEGDVLFEPFRGEGAFYNAFPETHPRLWCEITQGRDYKDISGGYDWVITNPPFRLDISGKRVNGVWTLLDYFTQSARKGVAMLMNDKCFSALTPLRLQTLSARGFHITAIRVCNVKKWRGRYFYIIVEKKPSSFYQGILGTF